MAATAQIFNKINISYIFKKKTKPFCGSCGLCFNLNNYPLRGNGSGFSKARVGVQGSGVRVRGWESVICPYREIFVHICLFTRVCVCV